ncbi:hypothetical protein N431DRAFT_389159 [Stipitochalara longipes BDJ]|nr:hypothetical protein N431DRAFT_389159 [Stipitochalara longipes BDJ]
MSGLLPGATSTVNLLLSPRSTCTMPTPKLADMGVAPRIRTRLDPTLAKRKPVADIIYYEDPTKAVESKLTAARQQAVKKDMRLVDDKALDELARQLAGYTPLKPLKSWMLEKRERADPTGTWGWQEASLPIHLRKFKCFGRLPTELRLHIWKLARPEPRIVRLQWPKKMESVSDSHERNWFSDPRIVRPCYSKAPIPAMLHTCTESRQVALGWYKLSFRPMLGTPRVFFDFRADYLHVGCESCKARFCDNCEYLINRPDGDAVQRILCGWQTEGCSPFFAIYLHLRGVKEILIFDPSTDVLMGASFVQLSNLQETTKKFKWQEGKVVYDDFLKEKDGLDHISRMCSKHTFSIDAAGNPFAETKTEVDEASVPYFRPERIVRVELAFKPVISEQYQPTNTNFSMR